MLGAFLLFVAAAPTRRAFAEDSTAGWQDTPESLRVDDSAILCTYARYKANAEKAFKDERAYSKKYGVTDLRELNRIKHWIEQLDAHTAAAAAGLRKRSQTRLTCKDPLLVEFIACTDDQSNEDFRAMQEEDRYADCHLRGFGLLAPPAGPTVPVESTASR